MLGKSLLIDYSVEKLLIHCWQAFGCWGQLITMTFAPQSIISNLFPSLIWNNSFSQKIILYDLSPRVENEWAVKYSGATNKLTKLHGYSESIVHSSHGQYSSVHKYRLGARACALTTVSFVRSKGQQRVDHFRCSVVSKTWRYANKWLLQNCNNRIKM